MKRISAISKEIGLSVQTVYKHFNRVKGSLDGHTFKENSSTLLDDFAEKILKEAIGATTVSATVPAIQDPDRLSGIEKALLAVAEKMSALADDNRLLREQLREMKEEHTASIRALIAPVECRQVQVWQPQPRPDPLQGKGFFSRLWIKATAPERLRRLDG